MADKNREDMRRIWVRTAATMERLLDYVDRKMADDTLKIPEATGLFRTLASEMTASHRLDPTMRVDEEDDGEPARTPSKAKR